MLGEEALAPDRARATVPALGAAAE
jgi:hypothetical protein